VAITVMKAATLTINTAIKIFILFFLIICWSVLKLNNKDPVRVPKSM
jgi:hypothetical protein